MYGQANHAGITAKTNKCRGTRLFYVQCGRYGSWDLVIELPPANVSGRVAEGC